MENFLKTKAHIKKISKNIFEFNKLRFKVCRLNAVDISKLGISKQSRIRYAIITRCYISACKGLIKNLHNEIAKYKLA
jgi:hypothetical protein